MPQLLAALKGLQAVDVVVKILLTVAIAAIIIAILPVSPFQSVVQSLSETPYLGYLNWFFPIGRCLTVLVSWGIAIGTFYGVSWILRQLDIIGG